MINTGQGLIFLAFLFGGIINGLIYEILRVFKTISANFIYNIIIDILLTAVTGAGLLFWAFLISYGEIRLYSVFSYLLGFFLLKKILGKHFISLRNIVYNQICKLIKDNHKPER